MGSAQSLVTSQNLLAAIIITVFVATVWRNYTNTNVASANVPGDKVVGKKGKKKKPPGGAQDTSVAASATKNPEAVAPNSLPPIQAVPGGILELTVDPSLSPSSVSKPVKKKRKGKKPSARSPAAAASESLTPVPGPSQPPTDSGSTPTPKNAEQPSTHPPTTEPWTRVESRRKISGQNPATSDAGITTATSVEEDGSSSGTMERTQDEESNHPQRTLAEKLLPKGRKTAVDDMLETPHYPELSRVIRVAPAPSEKPAVGFSWGDYEDVEDVRGADADGEGDGGWGVVKSRGKAKHSQSSSALTSPLQSKAPETLTKKQRQNAAKRAAEKAAKQDAEAARQALLAKHKRELSRERISAQFPHKGPGSTRRNGNIVNPDG